MRGSRQKKESMPEDLSSWKTKAEASAFVGVSEKAIERAADRDVQPIRSAWRRDVGKKPCRVFHPGDLQKWRSSMTRQVTGEVVTTTAAGTPMPFSQYAGVLAEALGKAPGSPMVQFQLVPARKPGLLLTLQEAIAYSGLTETCILRHIHDGALPALKDGGWKIRRDDLRFLVNQLTASRQGTRAAGQ
jgi:hypothetical protein